MAVLLASKQLARIQGDDAQGHVTKVLLSLLEGHENVAAGARHTLDALGLGAVVEARSGEQRMSIASAKGPRVAAVEVIGEIVQDYGWEDLTNSAQSLRWCHGLGSWRASRQRRADGQFSTWCPHGTRRGGACFIVPLRARWQARYFDARRRAVMCGGTCGHSAAEAATFHHGRCSRCSAAGAKNRRRFGRISVPLPWSVGCVRSAPIGGAPKPSGHCVSLGRCH